MLFLPNRIFKIINPTFCFSNALGAIAVLTIIGSTPSAPSERLFLHLSLPRLIIAVGFLLLFLVFTILSILSIYRANEMGWYVGRILRYPAITWILLFTFSFSSVISFLLLNINPSSLGNFQPVYERFSLLLGWMSFFGLSAAVYILFCKLTYFADFIKGIIFSIPWKEIRIAAVPFIVLVVIKTIFVIPGKYDLSNSDEYVYFNMVQSLFQGTFSIGNYYHYPILYPLSIVPALAFKGSPYENIRFLNVIYSSSLIFPAFLLSRQFLSPKKSLLTVCLLSLLPFHLIYPRMVMSENLYYSLFLWVVYLIYVTPIKKRYHLLWDILIGVIIGAMYLTRYITLAIIPAFLFGWWLKPFESESGFLRPGFKKVFHFFMLCFSALFIFSPWLVIGRWERVPYSNLLGFAIYDVNQNPLQLTMTNLVIWIILYLCYSILIGAPFLNILLINFQIFERKHWREGYNRFLLVVLVIIGFMLVVSIRHSWKADYNFPLPIKIMGRYLIYNSGFFCLIAMITIERYRLLPFVKKQWGVLAGSLISFILVILSYQGLNNHWITGVSENLIKSPSDIEGFLFKMMGINVLPLIATIYILTTLFVMKKQAWAGHMVFTGCLIFNFIIGIPGYYREFLVLQPNPTYIKRVADIYQPVKSPGLWQNVVTVYHNKIISWPTNSKNY